MNNSCLDVIRRRRSIRSYTSEQIKEEELQAILEAGKWAPSAHNSQPWHFTVIQNRDVITHISEVSKRDMCDSPVDWVAKFGQSKSSIFYDAPTLIVVSGKAESPFMPRVDCSAAIENMLLAAESLNIGSCWIGLIRYFFEHEEEVKVLQFPDGYEPFYGVCLGYKAVTSGNGAERQTGTVNYIR